MAGPRTFSMASAVFTGTVDFSTTIFEDVDTDAIMRAAPSQYVRSAALPAPTPRVFVGVFTLHMRACMSAPHQLNFLTQSRTTQAAYLQRCQQRYTVL